MKITMTEDNYYRSYTAGQYAELKKEQAELEQNTNWETDVENLSIVPMATPLDVQLRMQDPSNQIPYDILSDTAENTGIMLAYNGKESCLRDCAIPSLLTTAGISGAGISRVEKEKLAEGISAFLTGSRAKSQVLTRCGKVSAIVSNQYQYMKGTELLTIAEGLEITFGTPVFRNGSISHAQTTAEWEFPDSADEITLAYNNALQLYGRSNNDKLMPVVQLRTSDTSSEAAKLITFLKHGSNMLLPLGGCSVTHIPPLEFDGEGHRITCLQKFSQESETLFAKLAEDISTLIPKMLSTHIEHPGNTFVALCKYAIIPQKWGGCLEEEIRNDFPDGSDCTFLDIYEKMTETTSLALADHSPESKRILDLEEGISKVARNHAVWKKYDLPGSVSWSAIKTY